MTIPEAAAHWRQLADEQDGQAKYARSRGLYDGVEKAKAATYRRCAETLDLEASTGLKHCHACLGAHPAHECPQRPEAQR